MKYYISQFFIVSGLLCFLLCSHDNTAGVISETTNGAHLEGKLFDIDGEPGSDIPVILQSIESCRNCPVNIIRMTVSKKGWYTFDDVPEGTFVVQAVAADSQAAALTITIPYDTGTIEAADLNISNSVTKSGIISAPSNAYPVTVSVCGTGKSVLTDMGGRFTLSNLPKAEFLLHLSSASQPLPAMILPAALITSSDTIIYENVPRTVIDNFDDGDGVHLLAPFTGSGRWYERHDDTMVISPAVAPDDLAGAITEEGAWRKKSLIINVKGGNSGELFIVACELGKGLGKGDEPMRWFDLTGMTGLSFAAKGKGSVHVALLTKKIYDEYSGADHFEKIITLSPEWTQYRIEADEFKPPEGSIAAGEGETWRAAATHVAEISFFTDDEAFTFGLDDLCIEGVNSLDMLKSGTR